jgi:hypothetical protein
MKRTRFLLVLDTILLLSLVFSVEPRFEGLAIHEWLGLALIPLITIHILSGWQWIISTLTRLGAKGVWRLRANAFLNLLLFITFTVTVFSGTMTSFIALPALGIAPGNFERWRLLHNQWEVFLEILVGLHIAMNGGWIVNAIRRQILLPLSTRAHAILAVLAAKAPDS